MQEEVNRLLNFTFSLIEDKLIWIDFMKRQVWWLDCSEVEAAIDKDKD